jgi:hypothetical protein
MTHTVRASLRATGQIIILAIGVSLIVRTVGTFVIDIVYLRHAQVESWQLIYAVSIVLGVVGLWASTQPDSNRGYRIAAVSAASAMAVAMCAAVLAIYLDTAPVFDWFLVVSFAVGLLWPVGGLVCLALSYLGAPLGLAEPGALRPRSPWLWMIVAPLAFLDVLLEWLVRHYGLPESPVLSVFAAGLLYGLMRRRNPVAGAGGWALATGRLLALMVPAYVVRLAAALSAGNGLLLGRASIAMAVVVAILVAVAGFHVVGRRRYTPSGTTQ